MIVVINQDLVAQVRHAWIADQQHPQRARRARPLPDSERLGILLDTVSRLRTSRTTRSSTAGTAS